MFGGKRLELSDEIIVEFVEEVDMCLQDADVRTHLRPKPRMCTRCHWTTASYD